MTTEYHFGDTTWIFVYKTNKIRNTFGGSETNETFFSNNF